jgi:hypothetical protein
MGVMFEAIIIVSIVSLIFWFFSDKKNRKYIYLAAAISFLWVYFSGLYGYRESNYVILGLNLFAFSAWTAGLVLVKKIYDFFKFKGKYFAFIVFYMVSMVTLEYIGYNLWNIKLATHYPGIFGIEAMHMPWWGKTYYLTSGLIFVRLDDIIKWIKDKFGKKKKKLVRKKR